MKSLKHWSLLGILFSLILSFNGFGQKATYNDVLSKKIKGSINTYESKDGQTFRIGDTLTLGQATKNGEYAFIKQNAGLSYEPLPSNAASSQVVIKKMTARYKTLTINTTKPQGYVFALWINNLEGALSVGEIKSNVMTSDEALAELKKWKSKLDLEIISQEEYNAKKDELMKYIK